MKESWDTKWSFLKKYNEGQHFYLTWVIFSVMSTPVILLTVSGKLAMMSSTSFVNLQVEFSDMSGRQKHYWIDLKGCIIRSSVATKIENGPKTNTKILRFLKMDRRRIRRIFVNSKILRRSSKIANSSNIFEDTKIFKGKWKIFVVRNFLSGSNLDKFSQQ